MMSSRVRLTLICAAAAIVGTVVGFASSNGWSYARDRLRFVSSPFGPETVASIPAEDLAVAVEFVELGETAAFEKALFEAEQIVRQRSAPKSPSTRWLIYRSREHTDDGRVMYMVWFEQHGDLERSALSDVLPLPAGKDGSIRRCPEHAVLTLVPVMLTP